MSRQTRVERLGEIFAKILDILDADGDADQIVGDANRLPPLGRNRRVGHRRGMADQCFHAAEAFGQRHEANTFEQGAGAIERSELDRDQASETAHLTSGQRVLRMRGQAGIVHAGDFRVRGEEFGQRLRVGVVPLHADRQGLGSAQHEPGVHRPENGALGVLHEPQPLDVLVTDRHDDAADAVAVAVEELRRAVDDQIRAEVDRPLDVGTGERVVHDHEDPARVRQLAGALEIRQPQCRVGRRLEEQHLRRGPDRLLDLVEPGRVHVAEVELILPEHPLEQSIRAAVCIVGDDDVVARLEKGHHRALGGHA